MSSLFGVAPTPSLFGTAQSTAPPTSQTQPGQTSSVFSNTNTSQPTAQPSWLSNLGGQPNPLPTSNLFGSTQPQQQGISAGGGTSFGGGSNAGAVHQSAPADQPAQAQKQNGHSAQAAYFESLLEKNRKRNRTVAEDSGLGEVPSLQLGLGDISKRLRELGSAGNQGQGNPSADSKAYVQERCLWVLFMC